MKHAMNGEWRHLHIHHKLRSSRTKIAVCRVLFSPYFKQSEINIVRRLLYQTTPNSVTLKLALRRGMLSPNTYHSLQGVLQMQVNFGLDYVAANVEPTDRPLTLQSEICVQWSGCELTVVHQEIM